MAKVLRLACARCQDAGDERTRCSCSTWCGSGHTAHELDLILEDRRLEFDHWMRGQTMGICDGRKYNHDTGEYEPTGCGPHGTVVYSWDLARFLHGLPVTD
jgi:hypothetical protein